jgi:hypothetical protein
VSDTILVGDIYAILMLNEEPPPYAQKKAAE